MRFRRAFPGQWESIFIPCSHRATSQPLSVLIAVHGDLMHVSADLNLGRTAPQANACGLIEEYYLMVTVLRVVPETGAVAEERAVQTLIVRSSRLLA